MVQTLMYCAEQIVIPENFQNILKTYAKAAIKTQPYDLLRWSAAYFRCMAIDEIPPVKPRLEKDLRYGHLTRGYLRILLEQLGKGFFINRDVLHQKWADLSLPEEELLKFLSLCRMLHWSQVHWLKLFAVMVGSINTSFKDSIIMICELLTNEPEGGPNPIPMWMFRECYTFVAELDCNEEQEFSDGRKVLPNGKLEKPRLMPTLPKVLSVESFRNAVLERWNERIGLDASYNPKNVPVIEDETNVITPVESKVSLTSTIVSQVSSSFKFIGDFKDPYEVIRRAPDYDSIILLLHEAQGDSLHKYDGPDHITEENLAHAKQRELDVQEQQENQSKLIEENAKQEMTDKHLELLRHIEPPWSWIHEFTQQNNLKKSYNFIECASIPSNATPPESSDESFDFERGKFISSASSDTTLESEDSCEAAIEKEIIPKSDSAQTIKTDVSAMANDFINEIIETIISDKKIDITTDTKSLLSFLENEIGKSSENQLNMISLERYLLDAENEGIQFKDLDQLHEYLKEKFGIIDVKEVASVEVEANLSQTDIEQLLKENVTGSEVKLVDEQLKDESVEELAAEPLLLESKFDECDIEIDDHVAKKAISDNMILGLVEDKKSVVEEDTVVSTPRSSYTSVTEILSKVQQTSPVISTAESSDTEPPAEEKEVEKPIFNCTICKLPGIGKTITKRTQKNFLTYLKARSQNERGMIFPRHFKERKCPNMLDADGEEE